MEKDIQQIGAAITRLVERRRPLTLDDALANAPLLDLDLLCQRAGVAGKTREYRRGIRWRLHAVHRGLPWWQERRADGKRIGALPGPEMIIQIAEAAARAESADDGLGDVDAFLTCLDTQGASRVFAGGPGYLGAAGCRHVEGRVPVGQSPRGCP